MGYQVYLQQHRSEFRLTQTCTETMLAYASEQGFSYWAAIATILNGWALVMQGHCETGLVELDRGISTHQHTGAVGLQPYFQALLAEAYARASKLDVALKTVTEALTLAGKTHESYYQAELHRLKGELMLLRDGMDAAAAAEACLQQSLAIARRQQARAWELRTAISLARLWGNQSKHSVAFELLAPVCRSFTEGFDDADLQDAKALLDALV